MRCLWGIVLVLVGVIAAAPVVSPEDSSDLKRNLSQLHELRDNQPDQYRRLLEEYRSFIKLDPEKQQRIRSLDSELQALEPGERKRRWSAMVRYKSWHDSLSKENRHEIDDARTTPDKLQIIRKIRREQWLERLPLKKRNELRELQKKNNALFNDAVVKLQNEEKALRQQWGKALPPPPPFNPKPRYLKEFPLEVQAYVDEMKRERLTDKELGELNSKEGQWPEYARLIRDLADKHPVLLPLPLNKGGKITKWEQLNENVQMVLKGHKQRLLRFENKWPTFAIEVNDAYLAETGKKPSPLGASSLDDFPKEMQEFIKKELMPLSEREKVPINNNDGKWPEYPKSWLNLARRRGKVIPGMSLPGPPAFWKGIP